MKVSIITVCYNSEKTIKETLESVLQQEYKNIEYIIKDGGSKDNTIKIVKSYEKKFKGNLKIIESEDKGIYEAMNQALAMTSGEIIGLINSDDVLAHKYVITDIVEALEKNNCDAIYGDLIFLDAETLTIPVRNFVAHKEKGFGWHPPHPTLYIKKEVYEEIGNFKLEYKIAADYDFMLRLLKPKKYKLFYIKEYLVKMRTGGASTDGLKGYIKSLKEAGNVLKENQVRFPFLCNMIRICKTIWQGISAKIFKKKILNKLNLQSADRIIVSKKKMRDENEKRNH